MHTTFQLLLVAWLCVLHVTAGIKDVVQMKQPAVLSEGWCENRGGIQYRGTCLWAETAPEIMTVYSALRTCNQVAPSKLPEFTTRDEYLTVMAYLRDHIPELPESIETWTGMTRDYWTGTARLSNGDPAPYTKHVEDPEQWTTANELRTNVYLYAYMESDSEDQGMGAIWPTYSFSDITKIVLCQGDSHRHSALTPYAEAWCKYYGGIEYSGTCLWSEVAPHDMDLGAALATCNARFPSELPDIYGGGEYIRIMEYLRTKIPEDKSDIIAWTGMTRKNSTGPAILPNGDPAPYTRGRTRYGKWRGADPSLSNIYLLARSRESSRDQGMGVENPSFGFPSGTKIVLCQMLRSY